MLAKCSPNKIKCESEGLTALTSYNSSVAEVLGRKETHQLANQGHGFLEDKFSSKLIQMELFENGKLQ